MLVSDGAFVYVSELGNSEVRDITSDNFELTSRSKHGCLREHADVTFSSEFRLGKK